MADIPIVSRRLLNQGLTRPRFTTPIDVVRGLAAVQAQDYGNAKWSIGLRLRDAVEADVEAAVTSGAILRLHLLRPTWHFVDARDVRWLLSLTAPRVHALNAPVYRMTGLDAGTLKRTTKAFVRALERQNFMTRDELRDAVRSARIEPGSTLRMAYALMHAELEGIVCSGPRRGKQFTYALLERRAPAANPMERDAALAELTRRYFTSRGPATAHDFAKWSSLPLADVRRGIEITRRDLERVIAGDGELWQGEPRPPARSRRSSAFLLSIYDEMISGYRDYQGAIEPRHAAMLKRFGNSLTGVFFLDARIGGTWKREVTGAAVNVSVQSFSRLNRPQKAAIRAAADRYARFFGLRVRCRFGAPAQTLS